MPDDAHASALPLRPALYAVLGSTTDHAAAQWVDAPDRGGVVVTDEGARLGAWLSNAAWTVADVGEALERLINADLLPPAWVDDTSRRFHCAGAPLPRPATLPALVAWASLGPAQVMQAEELARDAVRRLAPWGVVARERRAVWAMGLPPVRDPEEAAWRRDGLPQAWPRAANEAPHVAAGAWTNRRDAATRAGASEELAGWIAHVETWPAGAPPCPHAPLLALLRAGLALDRITDEDLVLVVPPLPAP
jgi:hypothetical protein